MKHSRNSDRPGFYSVSPWPQLEQNLLLAGFSVPHSGQKRLVAAGTALPQVGQNLALAGIWDWQWGQVRVAGAAWAGAC